MKRDPRFDILFEPVQIFGMTLSKARPWIKGISANCGAGRSMPPAERCRPDVLEEAREAVDRILSTHRPLPLDEEIDRELDRIKKRAAGSLS
jgi:hypothetical protein